ncbi:arylamine N-acetyltransferase family protein [Bacillus massilinigeriensis]|uniref:arylamine N-acetyltransferase family protein n=1 Tax=Bacillus massilionigeriensis TaxID=1805475 RepID=UPI00096AFF9D|nr:arylamine N-acetyltransferase [Bacillus massilionigeriensis]
MERVNTLFRRRIDFPENEEIIFEMLNTILEKTALSIPFENLCIFENEKREINKRNLIDKLFYKNQGGLCYELNTMLYYFLQENGFDVSLIRGIVYNHSTNSYPVSGRTHITILLNHQDNEYIVDTGFGGNLPLKPVPLNGEIVNSFNGEFRIKKVESEYGDHVLEMKLRHKDTDWKIGYAFQASRPLNDLQEVNEVQQIIHDHPHSPFNKNPLVTRLTKGGNITLTDTSITHWHDGKMEKKEIHRNDFNNLVSQYFQYGLLERD